MTTTYRGYAQPTVGATGWDTDWNNNWDAMDQDLGRGYTPAGLDANKPASPSVGDTYLATDTGIFYKCISAGVWTGTIAADEIPAGAIGSSHIVSGAVTTAKLSANAVTTAKLSAGAITAAKFVAGAVDQYKIADGAADAASIAAAAVTAAKIASGAVDTASIAPGAVTRSKIATAGINNTTTSGLVTTQYWDLSLFRVWRVTYWGDYITCESTGPNDWRDITEFSTTISTTGGPIVAVMTFNVYAKLPAHIRFSIDGVQQGGSTTYAGITPDNFETGTMVFQIITGVSADTHTFVPVWSSPKYGGYIIQNPAIATYDTNLSIPAVLTILEIKR